MLKFVVENIVIITFLIVPGLIILIQLYRFWTAEDEYKSCYKKYIILLKDYGKGIDKAKVAKPAVENSEPPSSGLSQGSDTVTFTEYKSSPDEFFHNDEIKTPLLKMLTFDPYEWFISYRNTKTELFKSYVVVPLELYFYLVFMVSVIYALGYGIYIYINDPLQGFGSLIEGMHKNWIGALILFAVFMHRIVLKKIEDIKKIKDVEFKEKVK